MGDQLSLLGMDEPTPMFRPQLVPGRGKPLHYSLFLALLPEAEDAQRLHGTSQKLNTTFALDGKCLTADRLHVTLHALDGFRDEIEQSRVDAMLAAAARVEYETIDLLFDRFCSFGKPGSSAEHAQVLCCDSASARAVSALRQRLRLSLRQFGLSPTPSSTPHMTLMYAKGALPEHAVEPVKWTARRLVLILSHVGIGYHQHIGEWSLKPRSQT